MKNSYREGKPFFNSFYPADYQSKTGSCSIPLLDNGGKNMRTTFFMELRVSDRLAFKILRFRHYTGIIH